MLNVIKSWKISTMFVDVLLKFGDQPAIFQESSGCVQSFQSTDGSFGKLPPERTIIPVSIIC
jgi:hypothetical protein